MIALTVVPNESAAEVVCGLLRANGIACGYGQTNLGAGAADGFPTGGPVEIFVADGDAEEARKLLEAVGGGH
jgi:Putative prokaryotic signal transducing protein